MIRRLDCASPLKVEHLQLKAGVDRGYRIYAISAFAWSERCSYSRSITCPTEMDIHILSILQQEVCNPSRKVRAG